MEKDDLKITLLYLQSIDKKLEISKLSNFFSSIAFSPFSNAESLVEHIKYNQDYLIILDLDSYNHFLSKISVERKGKTSVIIYDPDKNAFNHHIDFHFVSSVIEDNTEQNKIVFSIGKALSDLKNKIELSIISHKYSFKAKELRTLNSIGIALSTEKDIDKILETILVKAREITSADSGSLYIVQEKDGEESDSDDYFKNKEMLFKLAQNTSIKVNFQERVLELNKKSISGYVAITGKPMILEDAYHLPEDAEYSFNKSFDASTGYRSKSMLIVPMKNQKDEIIGVIQLINKKTKDSKILKEKEDFEKFITHFDTDDEELVYSLASQAAILIDNTKLYLSIKNLFEGFIKASVTAIESRDPTTSGHSERVAGLTVALAEKVDSISDGVLSTIKFTKTEIQQIKYASLLHDFGKIGVKEDVLVKAKKLYPYEMDSIIQRFNYIKKCIRLNSAEAKLDYIVKHPKEKALMYFDEIDGFYNEKIQELDNILNIIKVSNEPAILAQEASDKLKEIVNMYYEELESDNKIQYITPYEFESLSILKGSLRDNERLEIESHVTHTYEFLSKIPWTTDLKSVPEIAYSHHEKLDGTGYPRHINSENIPTPSKMMAISDIYDALTASDRPYKKALPVEKAIDILGFEVKAKKLDADLFKVFVDSKIYEVVK